MVPQPYGTLGASALRFSCALKRIAYSHHKHAATRALLARGSIAGGMGHQLPSCTRGKGLIVEKVTLAMLESAVLAQDRT